MSSFHLALQSIKTTTTTNSPDNLVTFDKMADTSSKDDKPLFFWREFEEPWGFMSQWYDSPFEVDGVMYASTEMWMMIQKAKLFGDEVC